MKRTRLIVQFCACAVVIALGVFALRPEAPAGAESAASARFEPVGMLKEGQAAAPYVPLSGAAVGYDSKVTDVRVLNTSAIPASVLFEIYDSGGAPAVFAQANTVAARGGKSFNESFIPLPAAFSGAALLSSTEPLLSIINIGGAHSMMGYTAATAGATEVYLPAIFKNAYAPWYTNFSVQNTGSASATVTMTYFNGTGTQVHTATDAIPANSVAGFNEGAIPQLPDGFEGWAEISTTSPTNNIVAIVNEMHTSGKGIAYGGVNRP